MYLAAIMSGVVMKLHGCLRDGSIRCMQHRSRLMEIIAAQLAQGCKAGASLRLLGRRIITLLMYILKL